MAGREVEVLAGREVEVLAGREVEVLAGREVEVLAGRDVEVLAGREVEVPVVGLVGRAVPFTDGVFGRETAVEGRVVEEGLEAAAAGRRPLVPNDGP